MRAGASRSATRRQSLRSACIVRAFARELRKSHAWLSALRTCAAQREQAFWGNQQLYLPLSTKILINQDLSEVPDT